MREGQEVREVVVTSFLDDLPYPGEEGHAVVEELPGALAAKYRELRG